MQKVMKLFKNGTLIFKKLSTSKKTFISSLSKRNFLTSQSLEKVDAADLNLFIENIFFQIKWFNIIKCLKLWNRFKILPGLKKNKMRPRLSANRRQQQQQQLKHQNKQQQQQQQQQK
jgi:hypothetical protein